MRDPDQTDSEGAARAAPTRDELASCLATLEALHALPRSQLVALPHSAQILAAGYSLARRSGRDARDRTWKRPGAIETPEPDAEPPKEPRRRPFQSPDAVFAMTSEELVESERRGRIDAPPQGEAMDAGPLRALRCYLCDAPFRGDPSAPERRCSDCVELERRKRERRPALAGRVALVTGGRVRIGYAVCVSLLRAGATVHATSRFAASALDRFAREPDYGTFAARLAVHSLDLCDLPATERFAERFVARFGAPDILVNNAARTIDHPPSWLDEMRAIDRRRLDALPEGARDAARAFDPGPSHELAKDGGTTALDHEGQPLDPRPRNAWRAKIGEVPLRELLAVHAVNALAPFVLVDRFRSAMTSGHREAHPARFIVNVTSPEGRYYRRYKGPWHPHTNMAKAALDMMTRTCAEELASHGVFLSSVDPGWVSDQHTMAVRDVLNTSADFCPPVSVEDAAARVLDPVYSAIEGAPPAWGVVFRNYAPCPW
jgi:NAD(P)-dependent dehydrogenase (short-subunit alcohol dehydrogenase family)